MNKGKIHIYVYNLLTKVFGKKVLKKILLERYIKLYKKNDIIFVHIPKVAGTSITKELYGRRNGHLTAMEIKQELGETMYNIKFSFSITRNPYDRLVSSYFYAKQGGSKEGGVSNPEIYKDESFREFNTFVKEWLIYQNFEKIDVIFKPQYKFLYNGDNCIVDYVDKLENLSQVRKVLNSKFKKIFNFGHKNRSARSKNFMSYYDNETKELVNKLYEKDFILFDYDK